MGEGVIGWFLVALAADPAPPAQVADPEPYEVTVWGDAAIRQARAALVHELTELGWHKGRESKGQIVFRPPSPWMGRAVLDYDGTLAFRRPVLALKSARAAMPVEAGENPHFDREPGGLRYPPDDEGNSWALPHPEGTFWVLPSWSLLGPTHERVRKQVDPLLSEYRAVVKLTAERSVP